MKKTKMGQPFCFRSRVSAAHPAWQLKKSSRANPDCSSVAEAELERACVEPVAGKTRDNGSLAPQNRQLLVYYC